eukprot:14269384-Alexandrium_andersonii.AAC.1
MSASLVGSEMCIRDRFRRRTLRPWPAFGASWLGIRPSSLRKPLLRNPRPVSYTHLTLPTICSV